MSRKRDRLGHLSDGRATRFSRPSSELNLVAILPATLTFPETGCLLQSPHLGSLVGFTISQLGDSRSAVPDQPRERLDLAV